MNANNVQIGRALLDAFNARDLSIWESKLAEDVSVSYPGFREGHGKEAARLYNLPFITAFSDLNMKVNKVFENGDTVVYMWTGRGTHDGPWQLPTGIAPPTGRKAAVDGVLVATIKDGKIVREETYWNPAELLTQLGLM